MFSFRDYFRGVLGHLEMIKKAGITKEAGIT